MLPPPVPGQNQENLLCPNCRRQIVPTWQHCGYCGFQLTPQNTAYISKPSQTNLQSGHPVSHNSKSPVLWIVIGGLALGFVVVVIFAFAWFNLYRLPETNTLHNTSSPNPGSQQARTPPAAAQLPTQEPTATQTALPTYTATVTQTSAPSATPTPQGVSAVIPSPSQWQCLDGPGDTVYASRGTVDSKNVLITGKDNSKSWFRAVSPSSGRVCWVPIVALDRSTIDTNAVPIIEAPEPPGQVYYGYKYAICNTGWINYSDRIIQCLSKPVCFISYPKADKAFTNADNAFADCQKSAGGTVHCGVTMPYTITAVNTGTSNLQCSIARVDHSETDIYYELYWLNLP